ncbi:hypothetical protein [Paenibacillus glufosinatiresistens]|uniref:hypothetical protein n=1 Tax=Paenibacillus glufosinatiresistens TaxID=3070657 RepID=UPI00286E24B1|nr:hypothetical protein [Paenibacillus sp. YX.27]
MFSLPFLHVVQHQYPTDWKGRMIGILLCYMIGAIPAGAHFINRLKERIRKWTQPQESIEEIMIDAIYDAHSRDRGDVISGLFALTAKVIKLSFSFLIGFIFFPLLVIQLVKEIRRVFN